MHKLEGAPDQPDVATLGDITHAINFYRNLVVFERGDNTYPSNVGFNFADPAVQRIFALIEREAANNPAARNALSRIDMAIWGGDPGKAAELARQAAAANPRDAELLTELVRMMEWAGRDAEVEAIGRSLR